MQPSQTKKLAVQKFPQANSVKQEQSYLGLTGYFCKFMLNYVRTAKSLNDLLQNSSTFRFGPEQMAAVNKLNEMLS